jgi:hypothetical protein
VDFHAKVVGGEKFRCLSRAGQQHKMPPFVWNIIVDVGHFCKGLKITHMIFWDWGILVLKRM